MDWTFIAILIGWNIGGIIIVGILLACSEPPGAFSAAYGFEFVNPCHIYRYNRVNWFGAIIVALVYNFICPIGTLCYWIYKLCTVGRNY